MIIRTIAFNPIRVTVDDVEVPVLNTQYLDEDGNSQEIVYVEANGEKIAIQHRVEIMENLRFKKMDETLAIVEAVRMEKVIEKLEAMKLDPNLVKPKDI